MKKITRIIVLLSLVFILVASMAATAVAAKPNKGVSPSAVLATIYANDPGWVKTPSSAWKVEQYTKLPSPLTGEHDLLVANNAGVTASYTFAGDTAKNMYVWIYAAKYWSCGTMEIYLDGTLVTTPPVNLNSTVTDWGNVPIEVGKFKGPGPHTLTISATGNGGPGIIDGIDYSSYGLHYVNIWKVELSDKKL